MQKNIQHGDVSLHAIAKPEIELEEITHKSPNLFNSEFGEIKKDALLLLDF